MLSINLPSVATEIVDDAQSFLVPVLAVVAGVAIAFVLAWLLVVGIRNIFGRWRFARQLSRRAHRPLRALLAVIGAWVAIRVTTEEASWTSGLEHGMTIALIIALAWLLIQLAYVAEDGIVSRYPVDVVDNREARRVRTQTRVLRQLVGAIIVIVAVSAILLTFPGMRAFGASILASAGLLSIIAGLAAQSALSNLFAGMQLAFTEAIRVDDVVIADGEWGRIEEITMTYVVVQIWDSRRLILPSTYFTSTPFQNWTRESAELLGTVEVDVDWTVPIDEMRSELDRLLESTELWDGRVSGLQVTEATGGLVRVRALASAADASLLWDLRCYLREGLVTWVRQVGAGLPRTRLQPLGPLALVSAGAQGPEAGAESGGAAG